MRDPHRSLGSWVRDVPLCVPASLTLPPLSELVSLNPPVLRGLLRLHLSDRSRWVGSTGTTDKPWIIRALRCPRPSMGGRAPISHLARNVEALMQRATRLAEMTTSRRIPFLQLSEWQFLRDPYPWRTHQHAQLGPAGCTDDLRGWFEVSRDGHKHVRTTWTMGSYRCPGPASLSSVGRVSRLSICTGIAMGPVK